MRTHRLSSILLWILAAWLVWSCRGLGGSASPATAVTITQVTPLASTVYYGQATCGPTSLVVDVQFQARETPRQVGLLYRYVGTQQSDWQQAEGTPSGDGKYQTVVNMDAAAARAVGASAVEYRAFVVDAQGKATYFPAQGTAQVRLQPCTQGGAIPPQNPGSPSGGGSGNPPSGGGNNPPSGGGSGNPPSGGGNNPPSGGGSGNPPSGGGNNPPSGGGSGNPPSGGGNNPPSGGGSASLTIQEVRANPTDAVYFGPCTSGETTWLEIEAVVDDIQKVQTAAVHYRYESSLAPGDDFPNLASMARQQGIGNYVAHIDVGQEVPDHAAVERIVYYVEMTTTDGQTIQSPTYFHPLLPCSGQGQPPPSSARITDVIVYPDIGFYGACQAGEPMEIFFQVLVDPTSAVDTANLTYEFYDGNASIGKQGTLNLLLDQDAFVGQVDLSTALSAQDTVDTAIYFIEVTTKDGAIVTYGPEQIPLQRCTAAAAPSIVYFESLNSNDEVTPGTPFLLRWETENANCGVYLNGEAVNEDEPNEFAAGNAAFGAEGQTFSFTLEAYGGDCSQPLMDSATVSITVVPIDNGNQGSNDDQYRTSNYEQLYFGDGFDLDQDHVPDFHLFANAFSLTLEPENGSRMVFGTLTDDKFQTLETCIAALSGAEASEISLDVGDVVCIQTGAGYYGYVHLDEVYEDFGDVTRSYIVFSLFAQTAP